tara:strand:+ start:642 stop:1028 length:387 start_codon:yes stop_codon:yes gene_type:complete
MRKIAFFLVVFIISCTDNYDTYSKIINKEDLNGKWFGTSFYFKDYPQKKYNFKENSNINFYLKSSLLIINDTVEKPIYFKGNDIMLFSSSLENKNPGYQIQINNPKDKIRLSTLEKTVMIKNYTKMKN